MTGPSATTYEKIGRIGLLFGATVTALLTAGSIIWGAFELYEWFQDRTEREDALFEELGELKSNEDEIARSLAALSTEMATQSQRLNDLHAYAGVASEHREELDEGQKSILAELTDTQVTISRDMGYLRGIIDRLEAAADRLEAARSP